ncbi:MAG: histidine phosphatase family protein [Pyrinomonadaceae bacterium]
MAITRLLLIRHGQSAKNVEGSFGGHSDTPLSPLGLVQAKTTANALKTENIAKIYSSDLRRAVDTARPLGELLELEIELAPAFRERNVGRLEGLTFEETKKRFTRDYYALVNRKIDYRIPDGESYRDVIERTSKQLEEVIELNRGEEIAIFSHTGAICFMTLSLLNAIDETTRRTPWLVTSNCGINRFEIRKRRDVRVIALNDTRHLLENTGNDSFSGE